MGHQAENGRVKVRLLAGRCVNQFIKLEKIYEASFGPMCRGFSMNQGKVHKATMVGL